MSIELPRPKDWSVGARSETGYKRDENQDRMSRFSTALGDAYIVSDGMGGHNAGALAAQITLDTLQRTLAASKAPGDLARTIEEAFRAANDAVYRRAHAGEPASQGMGATALLLLTLRSSAIVAHVGDTRAYLVRDGKLRLLTKDHTRVQRMVDAGMLTEAEAKDHPDSSVLDRAMGHEPVVEVEIREPVELDYGDEILLCSDGLSSYVSHSDIEAVVTKPIPPSEQVDQLIALALASGGHDNVTVQVIRYEGGMNERKRQILTYQLSFLPLVAVIAAATSYGVEAIGWGRESADKPGMAVTEAAPAQSNASGASSVTPSTKPDVQQLAASVASLQQEVRELNDRILKLEGSRKPSSTPPPAPKKVTQEQRGSQARSGTTPKPPASTGDKSNSTETGRSTIASPGDGSARAPVKPIAEPRANVATQSVGTAATEPNPAAKANGPGNDQPVNAGGESAGD